jgi:hypothetical protein
MKGFGYNRVPQTNKMKGFIQEKTRWYIVKELKLKNPMGKNSSMKGLEKSVHRC